jgi:hypothetical protein
MNSRVRILLLACSSLVLAATNSAAQPTESSMRRCGFCYDGCGSEIYFMAVCGQVGCGPTYGASCEANHPGCTLEGQQYIVCEPAPVLPET